MEDKVACNLIAHSIGNVMRQSLDDNFKNECKRLLGATNTNEVEEILYDKLMDIAHNGSTNSTKQPLLPEITSLPENPSTSSATKQELLQVEKVPLTNAETPQNVPISEMYRRTIQQRKRSFSPQQANGTKSRFKFLTGTQSSAPF